MRFARGFKGVAQVREERSRRKNGVFGTHLVNEFTAPLQILFPVFTGIAEGSSMLLNFRAICHIVAAGDGFKCGLRRAHTQRDGGVSDMTDTVAAAGAKGFHIDAETYERMYAESIRDPEAFWREHGKRID